MTRLHPCCVHISVSVQFRFIYVATLKALYIVRQMLRREPQRFDDPFKWAAVEEEKLNFNMKGPPAETRLREGQLWLVGGQGEREEQLYQKVFNLFHHCAGWSLHYWRAHRFWQQKIHYFLCLWRCLNTTLMPPLNQASVLFKQTVTDSFTLKKACWFLHAGQITVRWLRLIGCIPSGVGQPQMLSNLSLTPEFLNFQKVLHHEQRPFKFSGT